MLRQNGQAVANTSAFDSWLRKITINACLDHLRKQSLHQVVDTLTADTLPDSKCQSPGASVEDGELQKAINRAVEQLPTRQKKVFMLRHYEGMALKEIAIALDCSLGTIKAHLFRATRRLRTLLSPYTSQCS